MAFDIILIVAISNVGVLKELLVIKELLEMKVK